ncbi:MAG: TAT-variant-translocated molybdopterin oxidoreductase [Deltaproteobacteria bacterium]|nr:TAT-variant-translocated molybdopterin oxidoreductase [Deltaproteobacteria bacterium]
MTIPHTLNTPLDLAAIRARLADSRGPQYWRSLEELANTQEFQEVLEKEFPQHASVWLDSLSRRGFLQLMGASMALAGLSACTKQPEEHIVPYTKPPEFVLPGRAQFYATAVLLGGVATGVLVESHTGRPTKIEGNPEHPGSLGSTDAFTQASILALYDPDRAQVVSHARRISSWEAFVADVKPALDAQRAKRGAGLRILTETVTSPTLAAQMQALLQDFPEARWHQYEPVNRDAVWAGSRIAFGEAVEPQYHFEKAEVILSLDGDFLFGLPGSVRYAREFSAKRKVHDGHGTMNRLYVAESAASITGSVADHRLSLRSGEIELLARAVAKEIGLTNIQLGKWENGPRYAKWLSALVRDLQKHKGTSVVVAGEYQPPAVHAIAHALNVTLGNVGQTVVYTEPLQVNPTGQLDSLRTLVDDMRAGKVELLVILGGNPAYTAPVDLGFTEAIEKVALRVHCSSHPDETAALCHWHIPEAHSLEAWGDARAYDGTVTVIQPLIAPLYAGKSHLEMVAVLRDQTTAGYDIVRKYWEEQRPGAEFERFWRKSVHDGVIAGTAFAPKDVSLASANWSLLDQGAQAGAPAQGALEIVFRPDPSVWDGRFANNGWLQELPKQLTKLTWDNAALMSPKTAERLNLANEEVIELKYKERKVQAAVWIAPGQPDETITAYLGYGRTHAGRVGSGMGFSAQALRTSGAPWFGTDVTIRRTGERYPLACTQDHHSMEGRDLVRSGTLEQFKRHPHFVHEMGHEEVDLNLSLYPEVKYEGYKWGMTIDTSSCIGCGACVTACQAENNIPIVGKEQVGIGREMHWIRVDRYYGGDLDHPEVYHQPVPCMQCENAPCEPVCPVGATVHSSEGLNDMVYNRCVGTRYCSNNCPYKVRRFNFFLYQDWDTPSLKFQRNPNVSIRSRGVMEKCTYCVQRINFARIATEKEDRRIHDGEIVTACQAACPAQAIIFGDLNDKESQVAKAKATPLNYGLLMDLNTRPRTTYLARLKNPNPEIENG